MGKSTKDGKGMLKEVRSSVRVGCLLVCKTSGTSVSLCWNPPKVLSTDEGIGESETKFEYQVRYYRSRYRTDGWKYSRIVNETRIEVTGLTHNTQYSFCVQWRSMGNKQSSESELPDSTVKNNKKEDEPWSDDSEIVEATTWTLEKEERMDNLDRLVSFLYKSAANVSDEESGSEDKVASHDFARPYDEPEHVADTYIDKASRGLDGLLTVATFVGFGGKYLQVAKNLWKVRALGLSALIFREELQSIVVALGSQVGMLGKSLGLSSKQVIVGCYYYLWESKQARLVNPENELQNHMHAKTAKDDQVLLQQAPKELLQAVGRMLFFARLSYRSHPAKVQWVLKSMIQKDKVPKRDAMSLVCFRGKSGHKKPAFCIFANHKNKVAVISIRGTKELEDMLTNHSFQTTAIQFKSLSQRAPRAPSSSDSADVDQVSGMSSKVLDSFYDADDNKQTNINQDITGPKFLVHAGMYAAAKWLIGGDCSSSPGSSAHENTEGGGLGMMVSQLSENGYKIIMCGHSLGGAVSILTALLLADENIHLKLKVYAFATPPCVDKKLSTFLHTGFVNKYIGEIISESPHCNLVLEAEKVSEEIDYIFSRIEVVNFIVRDDMIGRLSLHCLQQCALEIKHTQPNWEKYVEEDAKSLKERAKSLWAPPQRSKQVRDKYTLAAGATDQEDNSNVRQSPTETKEIEIEQKVEKELEFEVAHDESSRLFVPGAIIHTFHHGGCDYASVITPFHDEFNKIRAFENMKQDHQSDSIALVLRSIITSSSTESKIISPPTWEALLSSGEVHCGVCNYSVGWMSSIGGQSTAVNVRATHHCHNCGKIICPVCSRHKRSLPHIGIFRESRICDICEFQISSLPTYNWASLSSDLSQK